jgi:hypothetical protein
VRMLPQTSTGATSNQLLLSIPFCARPASSGASPMVSAAAFWKKLGLRTKHKLKQSSCFHAHLDTCFVQPATILEHGVEDTVHLLASWLHGMFGFMKPATVRCRAHSTQSRAGVPGEQPSASVAAFSTRSTYLDWRESEAIRMASSYCARKTSAQVRWGHSAPSK